MLEIVARVVVHALEKDKQGIAAADLLLELAIPLEAVKVVVGTDTVIVLVVEVQRVREATEQAGLRGGFANLSVAADFRGTEQVEAIGGEQPRVFLLRD